MASHRLLALAASLVLAACASPSGEGGDDEILASEGATTASTAPRWTGSYRSESGLTAVITADDEQTRASGEPRFAGKLDLASTRRAVPFNAWHNGGDASLIGSVGPGSHVGLALAGDKLTVEWSVLDRTGKRVDGTTSFRRLAR